ncbi:MAG TPA: hypothetical protein VM534_08435, partial [Thermoanaerobaculia bacterium]|nr:hypothetical protein [Thermoanaerobaculia bacterium]
MHDSPPRTGCPPPEELAAMAEGKLDEARASEIRAHLAECENCYETMSESLLALRALEEEETADDSPGRGFAVAAPVPISSRRRWTGFAIAATVILAAGLAGFLYWRSISPRDPIARLAAVAPEERTIEARLSGFDWAPLAPVTRGPEESRDWKLLAEAARIKEEAEKNPTAENLHALGVAHLLLGEWDQAVEELERAVEAGAGDSARGDLAGAHLQKGLAEGDPDSLANAYELSFHQGMNPSAPDLFNRALAAERLGLVRQARDAWEAFLRLEGSSSWAIEARRRLEGLRESAENPVPDRSSLERTLIEDLPARWSRAILNGRSPDASRLQAEGRRMLQSAPDLVALADWVHRDECQACAHAFIRFAEAREAYRVRNLDRCSTLSNEAKDLLERVGSPLVSMALLTRANCEFLRNELENSLATLSLSARSLRTDGQLEVVEGQIEWMRGLISLTRGSPARALLHYQRALESFQEIGDWSRVASVHNLLADTYRFVGNRRDSLRYSLTALRHSGENSSQTSRYVIALGIAESARDSGYLNLASAISMTMQEAAEASARPDLLADCLLFRAEIEHRRGNQPAMMDAFEGAARVAASIAQEAVRQRAVANIRMTMAEAAVASSPDQVPALLNDVERFLGQSEYASFEHRLENVRGNVLLRQGDHRGAEGAFRRAIELSEIQRLAFEDPEIQDDLLRNRFSAYTSLINSLVREGRHEEALEILERSRQ